MSTQPPLSFGVLLRRHRLAAGLTQEELAERARLSRGAIDTLERGTRQAPRKATIALLAEALALTASERAELETAAHQRGHADPPAPGDVMRASATPPTPTGEPPALRVPASADKIPMPETRSSAEVSSAIPFQAILPAPPRRRGKLIAGLVSVLVVVPLLGSALFLTGEPGASSRPGQSPSLHGGTLCLATDFPTSGRSAWAGKPLENAVNLAVTQNQNLGNGYTLKAINYDDHGPNDYIAGPHNVQQMVQTRCVVGMVGPYNSDIAALEMPIAANAGLVMISPTNTVPGLTLRPLAKFYGWDFDKLHPAGKPINYFQIAPNDLAQSIVDADFTFFDQVARSAYVVNELSPYGVGLAGFFSERF